jgi:hypothetical protein
MKRWRWWVVVVGERKDQTVVMSMMEAGWCFCANVTPTFFGQTRALPSESFQQHLRSEVRRAKLKSCHGFGGLKSKGALSLTL